MQTWTNIARLALIGTEQQPPELSTLGDEVVDDFLSKLSSVEEREAYLLKSSAVLTLLKRAGFQPKIQTPRLSAASPETLPRCPESAGQDLARMLRDYLPQVLPEWLELASTLGFRAPEELLPELLDHVKKKSELRTMAKQVLGQRGAWLAAQNADWAFAIRTGGDEKAWQEGKRAERIAALREIREMNPAQARELLVASWKDETPEDRAEFASILQLRLSLEDEDFLENALVDKRREVRVQAIHLLTKLPGSKLVQRLTNWATPLLQVKKQVLRGAALQITLPNECTREMELCGIGATKSPSKEIGEKAWWLKEILDGVPPSHWVSHTGLKPKELIQAALKSDWAKPVLSGWATAAGRFGDEDWIKAWLEVAGSNEDMLAFIPALRLHLPVSGNWQAALTELLRKKGSIADNYNLYSLIEKFPRPWNDSFLQLILSKAQQNLEQYQRNYVEFNHWRTLLHTIALSVIPALPQATSGWPKEIQANNVREVVDEFCSVIEFRRSMHRHFKGEN